VDTAIITLSSGQQFILNYSFSFGEMSIICVLLLLDVLFAARWMYDVVLQIWIRR
jgi:hypothetical protein